MVTASTAQGMTIRCLFVVQVIGIKTHGDTQYSVKKIQANNILNLTPPEHRYYQFILAAHMRCFLEENKFSNSAEKFIVPNTCPQKVATKKWPQKMSTKSVH